jgi:CheY-like chemotaxis protein
LTCVATANSPQRPRIPRGDLKSGPGLEHTSAIEEYIRSATNLTKQLLGLARGGKYEVRPNDLNELLLNSSNMFGRTKKEIRIHTQLHSGPLVVEVDQGQIDQVLLNLYVNAWQAMPKGGDLYLGTQIVDIDDFFIKSYNARPGKYALASITDSGVGMPQDIQQQIFDPFFTTKEKGRGTGLGLASAYGIIKNHEGIITVDSKVNQGTTFNIYLPLSDKTVHEEVSIEGEFISGTENLLLVDDETMILEVGQAMLEKLGYHVLIADSGEKALETIQIKGDELDLVILDLIMPGMDGSQVFDRIREVQPHIPVLLSSGYAINGSANEIMQRGCNGFIQKPFNISELSKKVRKILDEVKIN